MPLGPVSTGAILGVAATLVSAGIPLYYRYVWGEKSHLSLVRFSTLDDSEWRDGTSDGVSIWSRRCIIRVSNNGWRDGVISDVRLDKAVFYGDEGTREFQDPGDGVYKIDLEHYAAKTGEQVRVEFGNRVDYSGQIVGGRDDEMMAILPFLHQQGELGDAMKAADSGVFTYTFTIEDHQRVYETSVDVETSLRDSAGGRLQSQN